VRPDVRERLERLPLYDGQECFQAQRPKQARKIRRPESEGDGDAGPKTKTIKINLHRTSALAPMRQSLCETAR